jgi:hypothetical protein
VGVVVVTGWRRDAANPAFGEYAWTLTQAAAIAPVACVGGRGVRYLRGAERALVLQRWRAARGEMP